MASKVRLRDVLHSRKTVLDYTYDFGDQWEHRLTVTDVRLVSREALIRATLAAKETAPEDGGGIPGFYEWLEVIADPTHEGHAETKEWADEYGPDTVDELPIKYALNRIANRRNAPRTGSPTRNSSVPPYKQCVDVIQASRRRRAAKKAWFSAARLTGVPGAPRQRR